MTGKTIALVGNPNVGKSTVFNALTGMHQHTGNWPGKTVCNAIGEIYYKEQTYELVDLPGTYSLSSLSPDERFTSEYISSGEADIYLVVADATCLERNLLLVRDILSITHNVILCLNLMDEAEKKGISIDILALKRILKIPVICTSARSGKGLDSLLEALRKFRVDTSGGPPSGSVPEPGEIFRRCVTMSTQEPHGFDRKMDRILTSKALGFPIMFLLLILIFWITMVGANYPSAALSGLFAFLGEKLRYFLEFLAMPDSLISLISDGVYTTLAWVVSVMLPPMAIFFPMFTLLEDFGYLPRVAFNLDSAFKSCGAHGKQSLTMCMGFGCNACGVMGCRIIESPRERLIAILTNSFVPCNGRFPTLIAFILIFFTAGLGAFKSPVAGAILASLILLGILTTLLVSKLLSITVLKGIPSSFVLELPPYRVPKVGSVILRSIFDRTLFVLGRAIVVAAPAGVIIWLLANLYVGNMSVLDHCTSFAQPFGRIIGVDGVIVIAIILSFPANETFIPIMLMSYMSTGMLTDYSSLSQLHETLIGCGWDMQTAISVLILCLFHFPCGTTLLTIKKETGSLKWTALAFFLPSIIGIFFCLCINLFFL
ncbi:MAG: ferrous iron transporter B [Clostridiales bacterium]|nr:ferrous iron transporter B [Clostridiales bacterium]